MKRLSLLNKSGRGAEMGLSRMHALCDSLGLFGGSMGIVHVAGTNGKGSCATKVAYGLQQSLPNVKVGLFTSPHVMTYRERIQVNGEAITEDEAASILCRLDQVCTKLLKPTYFETLNLMAFLHFEDRSVDYAVIECGLGGRDDSTNVLPRPKVCVLTSVALDHQDLLGDTTEAITRVKAGIFKPDCHVVVGPNVEHVNIAQEVASHAKVASFRVARAAPNSKDVDLENSLIAQCALEALGVNVAVDSLCGILPPGRMEVKSYGDRPVLLDGAHNPDALQRLRGVLEDRFAGKEFYIVFAMSSGRDPRANLSALVGPTSGAFAQDQVRGLILTQGENAARAAVVDDLAVACDDSVLPQGCQVVKVEAGITEAFQQATSLARENLVGMVVVCGTFNALASLRALMDQDDEEMDEENMNERKLI